MKGFELLKNALRSEHVERIPWVPFVGCHAATLINMGAREFLLSADNMVAGLNKAIDLYEPDGIPVAFDLQIEAEALGCKLNWVNDNPPSVVSHPLLEGINIEDLKVPCACKGRIPVVLETARRLRDQHSDLALYGLVTGPFTLALHLLGTDIFLKMFEDPDYVHRLMKFTAEVAEFMSDNYLSAGCDVIALVDPMVSQIDPDSFKSFVAPYAGRIFSFIRNTDALSSFFVCGNARQNIEEMCKCSPDNISIDENIPLDYVKEVAGRYKISFGGNIKLTVSLLLGTSEDVQRDALECMDTGGKQGFILSPGCDLPMATPPENLVAVAKINKNEMLQGQMRASEAEMHETEKADLTDHWKKDKVVVDIITLDSSSCAPCQYMVDAVTRAAEPFGEKVVFKEYRIKEKQGIQMMIALDVKNLPTIVMDGDIEFISRIPPVYKIEEKIQEHLLRKEK